MNEFLKMTTTFVPVFEYTRNPLDDRSLRIVLILVYNCELYDLFHADHQFGIDISTVPTHFVKIGPLWHSMGPSHSNLPSQKAVRESFLVIYCRFHTFSADDMCGVHILVGIIFSSM